MISPVLRNGLAILAGLVSGSVLNMALVVIGPMLVPPPPGVDMSDMESLATSMHLFGPQHFVFPFLAHALGTLAGATTAFLLAGRNQAYRPEKARFPNSLLNQLSRIHQPTCPVKIILFVVCCYR
ncbi:MAG: hypothetical protein R3F41_10020 [Gammaproteobacteria bacterium]|nr:hypothetical protein [Pseudomonadales bacterium]